MDAKATRCHRAHAGWPKRARSGQRSEKRPGQRTKERSSQESRRGTRETEPERGVAEVRRSDGSEDARGGIQIHLASRSLERRQVLLRMGKELPTLALAQRRRCNMRR